MRNILTIFISILLASTLQCFGQTENFINFNTGNGKLGHNATEAIARDNFGYLWVGTNYGLNRLDGYQAVNYVNDPLNNFSLSSNSIKALCADKSGNLWVGTIGGGLNKYNRETNQFTRFMPNDTINSISGKNISAIVEDSQGNIWVGTLDKGLNKFDKKTGQFKVFYFEEHNPFKRVNSNVSELFVDSRGDIWVGLSKSEIFKIDVVSEKISYRGIALDSKNLNIGSITGISQLKNGNMLFTTWNGNLLTLDPEANEFAKIFLEPEFFNFSILSGVVTDSKNNIWIGTWNKGLFKLDSAFNIVKQFKNQHKQSYSISSNSINQLMIDENENLWVCLLDNGLSMLPLKEKIVKPVSLNSTQFDKVNVFSIVKDNLHNLWIGSRGQGLWRYNMKTGETENFLAENNPGLNSNAILSLKWSSENLLIIGTDGEFVSLYDPNYRKFTQVNHRQNDWSNAVFSIAENHDFIWVGTWGGGIKKIDKKTLTYQTISFDIKDQFRNSIFDLKLSDSILWVANVGLGLIRHNIETGNNHIYSQTDAASRFPNERITDIYAENANSLWLATDGSGCYHFMPDSDKIYNISEEYGINNKVFQSVMIDSNNTLWLTSLTNIYHLNLSKKESLNFDQHNGLESGQLNKAAICFDTETGLMFVGGVDGVNYFDPSKILIDSTVNKVIINQIDIMGETLQYPNGKQLKVNIDVAKRLDIYNNDKTITIHFASIDFAPSLKNKYYYQLDGFENHWIESPFNKNFIQYTNLRPGKYTFRVKACNSDGICSSDETTLKVVVHPALWQTGMFRLILLVIITVLLFLYFRFKNIGLVKAKDKLEKVVAERTSEIIKQKVDLELANNAKDKFFSIISHDLRSPLASIDQQVGLILREYNNLPESQVLKKLMLLYDTSTGTLDLIDQLLLWAKTQSNLIGLNKENVLVGDLLKLVGNHLIPIAKKKDIELQLPFESDCSIYADANSIQTVIRNLIVNSIKFTPTGGKVSVFVEKQDDSVLIAVSDNGIGMTKAQIDKLFKIEQFPSSSGTNKEAGTGLGLMLSYDFVKLNNGKIWVESHKGKGTTVFLLLPTENS